ncbi:hypothetical protein AVEN_83691-1 [Araneus ventricosus]|uniref:Retrotransposon gag domain-containing protein n=1 Tax=Araneus ventricosus TaxID=182803 RepID=A0A4Y2EZB7_ARAVE|nr:hypothetical protein AVEN_83691-1 [Araneus ventricosus]
MATPTYQIPAPEVFSFLSEDWSKWIARFERFRTASGLINKPEAEQDRYKFNMRMQEEDEAVEDFITALHNLAQNCKFPPSFGDEAILDRIVCGIRDKRVLEKLQLEADLTLEKAKSN